MKNINIIPDLLDSLHDASVEKARESSIKIKLFNERLRDSVIIKESFYSTGVNFLDSWVPLLLTAYDPEMISMRDELDLLYKKLHYLTILGSSNYYAVHFKRNENLKVNTILYLEIISSFFDEEERNDIYNLLTSSEKKSIIKFNKLRISEFNTIINYVQYLTEDYFSDNSIKLHLLNSENEVVNSNCGGKEFVEILEAQVDKYIVNGINDNPVNNFNYIEFENELRIEFLSSIDKNLNLDNYNQYILKKSYYLKFMHYVNMLPNIKTDLSEESFYYVKSLMKCKELILLQEFKDLRSKLDVNVLEEYSMLKNAHTRVRK